MGTKTFYLHSEYFIKIYQKSHTKKKYNLHIIKEQIKKRKSTITKRKATNGHS